MNIRLLSLAFFITNVIYISSQNQIKIFGYVTDENNKAIEYVNIIDKESSVGTTTSSKGYYELNVSSKSDSLEILFSFLGYKSHSKKTANTKKSTQINVKLEKTSKEFDDLVIRELRKQTSGTESLDTKNIKLIPGASGGIESMLASLPGVSSNNELSSQYSVRGGSYDENIVYVNDIEIYRPLLIRSGQQEGLSFINPDLVSEVNFSAGGFEAKYGDKMSSVLDIKYKKPTDFEGSVSISLLGASAYIGTKNKQFSQIHGVRYKTSKYLLGTLDTQGEYNPNFIDYQTFMTYELSKKWEISFLGNFSQNSYQFIPATRTTSFGTMNETRSFTVFFDGKEKDLFRTSFGSLNFHYKPNKQVKLELLTSAFSTNEEETYDITGQYWLSELLDENQTGNTLGIGTYHEHARNKLKASVINIAHQGEWKTRTNTLKWGLSTQQEIISDKIKEWEMRDSAGYSIPYNDENISLFYSLSGSQQLDTYRIQSFLQDTYKWASTVGTLTSIGGIRFNYWSFNKEMLVSPRLSVAFNPMWEKDFCFRLASGVYYQAPFYKELRYNDKDENENPIVVLNKNIKAQKTIHLVAGTDYYFRLAERPFKLTGEMYYKWASLLVPYQVENVRIRYLSNLKSTGYTTGIDLKLFGEMVPGTDSWIGLSLMNSKEDVIGDSYSEEENNIEPGYISRPSEQRYSFTLFFQDYFPNQPKYKVHLKLVWADGIPFGPPNSERHMATLRTPPYRRVDIGASRLLVNGEDKILSKGALRHIKNIWLTLEVFNLLDMNNVNSYYWVTDIYNQQYAVPNFLTSRQLNLKLVVDF